jgi:cytidylate kinase
MYLDTGAMYRAVTLYAIQHNLLESSEEEKVQMMSQIQLSFQYNNTTDHADIYLNGENVESRIRDT